MVEAPLDIQNEVLFVGLGKSAVAWYRCYLPAIHLGCDWAGIVGTPPQAAMVTGLVRRETKMPNWTDYKVVVLQQPYGPGWLKLIRTLQDQGIVVLFEVDDYLHGIQNQRDHDYRQYFTKDHMRRIEMCMKVCDGVICSTEFIARRYRKFNKRTFVCENGLDVKRYGLTRPQRPTVNIGWAGATAHRNAIAPWLTAVAEAMRARDDACFITIGQPYAQGFQAEFGNRAVATPFTALETYPAAMTLFDIALGPAGNTDFFRGKSDLRWLEAGALGVPIVANPNVYPKIEDGVTGFHAENPLEVEDVLLDLLEDEELRTAVGRNAREYVLKERDIRNTSKQWLGVFEEFVD